jgi:tRNA(Ile)-lysidine synthase
MEGQTASLADFMVNVKLPSQWRDQTALLVHEPPGGDPDQIAWVVGWRIDERVKVTPDTQRIVRLRWHKHAG